LTNYFRVEFVKGPSWSWASCS